MAIVRSLIHLFFMSSVLVDIEQEFRSKGKKHTHDTINLSQTMTLHPENHGQLFNSCSEGQPFEEVLSPSSGQHSRFLKHFYTGQSCLLFKQLSFITISLHNEQNNGYIDTWIFENRVKGPLKYLLMQLLGKNQLAITLHLYASIGPNLDNTHRGQIQSSS